VAVPTLACTDRPDH